MDSYLEKVESHHVGPTARAGHDTTVAQDGEIIRSQGKKHYSFYLLQLMLAMIALIVAWDVTALSLALPVSTSSSDKASAKATIY